MSEGIGGEKQLRSGDTKRRKKCPRRKTYNWRNQVLKLMG